jgi:hypothetical protein
MGESPFRLQIDKNLRGGVRHRPGQRQEQRDFRLAPPHGGHLGSDRGRFLRVFVSAAWGENFFLEPTMPNFLNWFLR